MKKVKKVAATKKSTVVKKKEKLLDVFRSSDGTYAVQHGSDVIMSFLHENEADAFILGWTTCISRSGKSVSKTGKVLQHILRLLLALNTHSVEKR